MFRPLPPRRGTIDIQSARRQRHSASSSVRARECHRASAIERHSIVQCQSAGNGQRAAVLTVQF